MNQNNPMVDYVMTHGREKSRCDVVDRSGVVFRIGNVVCDNKVYFVVSANSRIVECMEIRTSNHPTADVVPKSEGEALQGLLDAAIAGQKTLQEYLVNVRAEVARDIFNKINSLKKRYADGEVDGNDLYIELYNLEKDYAEVVK